MSNQVWHDLERRQPRPFLQTQNHIGVLILAATWVLTSCCSLEVDVEMTRSRSQAKTAAGKGVIYPNPLPVIPRPQEGYYSCWAACAEMVMEFVGGIQIRQCDQAGIAFSHRSCCEDNGELEPAGACDQQAWHPEFHRWGFDFYFRSDPNPALGWSEITKEINEGRPFLFSWAEDPPLIHMLVAVGYHELGEDRTVIYIDPLYDPVSDPIMTSLASYQGNVNYAHKADYYGICPKSLP